MSEFMSQTDAFTWAMESDARLRSTVVSVIVLNKSPDWEVVRARFEVLSREMPIWRQRVVESPPPTPPRWETAPDFDLDFHLRKVSAPEPGNLDGVLEMARVAAMADFYDALKPEQQQKLRAFMARHGGHDGPHARGGEGGQPDRHEGGDDHHRGDRG